ncbi:MAG TPA: EutN/CcmL family microcompartment protein [Planctomycetaceae bacterium]|jgi:ethanolamine utilization protein EutN|nr:EutN/CcmL family microcompartment protein [Planctomycetaceae bacterium]
MFLGRITGSLVATQKVASMVGQKLLVVEPLRVNEKDQSDLAPTGRTFVAVDTVGAGEGEVVLCVQGSSARFTSETKQLPIDAAVIGIVDQVQVGSNTVFTARATTKT